MGNDLSGTRTVLGGDRAVSSVIGVVLAVAITVLVATTVAVFALDMDGQVSEPAPEAAFDVTTEQETFFDGGRTYTATVAVVTYQAGEQLDAANLQVRVNGERAWNVTGFGGTYGRTVDPLAGVGTLEVGSAFRVVLWENEYDGYPVESDDLDIRHSGGCDVVFIDTDASDDCAMANDEVSRGDTIQIVYESPDSDSTTVISSVTI